MKLSGPKNDGSFFNENNFVTSSESSYHVPGYAILNEHEMLKHIAFYLIWANRSLDPISFFIAKRHPLVPRGFASQPLYIKE